MKSNFVPARQQCCRKQSQRGFSLIEVLVSIVLVSIGMVGLLGLLATSLKTGNNAQDRNRAALVVNELVSDMWLEASTDTSTGPLLTDYTALRAAIRDPNIPNLYVAPNAALTVNRAGTTATITLNWTPPNQPTAVPSVYTTQVTAP